MNEFQEALDAYAHHIRHDIGYPANEATLMLIGFAAGWEERGKEPVEPETLGGIT